MNDFFCFVITKHNKTKMDSECLYLIARQYERSKDYDLMKKYYHMAIEDGNISAMNNLGHYYSIIEKNYDEMKKYYRMAIDHGNTDVIIYLGHYYQFVEKDYDEMKKYYLIAIEHGHTGAMQNLGYYYQFIENNNGEMKKYYLMAIDGGNTSAMHNLGYYYHFVENNNGEMKKYYLMAIASGYNGAIYNLYCAMIHNSLSLELFCDEFKTKTITCDQLCLIYNNDHKKLIDELSSMYVKYGYSYILDINNELTKKIYGKTCIAECPICTETTECGHYPCDERHVICRDCYWKSPTQCYYKCIK